MLEDGEGEPVARTLVEPLAPDPDDPNHKVDAVAPKVVTVRDHRNGPQRRPHLRGR